MELAADISRGGDAVLLGKGTELTREHIEMLRMRGVEIVTVSLEEEPPAEPKTPVSSEALKKIVLEQHRWFGDTREDPVMNEVFRAVVGRLARGS